MANFDAIKFQSRKKGKDVNFENKINLKLLLLLLRPKHTSRAYIQAQKIKRAVSRLFCSHLVTRKTNVYFYIEKNGQFFFSQPFWCSWNLANFSGYCVTNSLLLIIFVRDQKITSLTWITEEISYTCFSYQFSWRKQMVSRSALRFLECFGRTRRQYRIRLNQTE